MKNTMNTAINSDLHLDKDYKGGPGHTIYVWRLIKKTHQPKDRKLDEHMESETVTINGLEFCSMFRKRKATATNGKDFYAGSTSAKIQDRLKTPKANQDFIINANSVELMAIKEIPLATPEEIKREEQVAINTVQAFCEPNEGATCLNVNRAHKSEHRIDKKLFNKLVKTLNKGTRDKIKKERGYLEDSRDTIKRLETSITKTLR